MAFCWDLLGVRIYERVKSSKYFCHECYFDDKVLLIVTNYNIFLWLAKGYSCNPYGNYVISCSIFFYKNQKKEYKDKTIEIELKWIIVVAVALMFFVWISGIGRLSVSNYDSPWRDAIYNDLVNYSWPVKYPETGYSFVYYYTFWLVF